MLGLITARGGSVRVTGKNLRIVGGKPLIRWTIDVALVSKLDRVILSTDDAKIASMCERVILTDMRPEYLRGDIGHSYLIEGLSDLFEDDYVMLLQPTSPLRSVEDINGAMELAYRKRGSVVSVCNGKENGAIYIIRKGWSIPYVYEMPEDRSLDIDTEEDIRRADEILSQVFNS